MISVSLFNMEKPLFERLAALNYRRVFLCFLLLGAVLFLRPPHTNFVYDEQEALLANPYLLGDVSPTDVLSVDFWGRSPETTIGSYRPLPNLLWRPFSFSLAWNTPWVLCLVNLVVHACTATVLCRLLFVMLCARRPERRGPNRLVAGIAGGFFATAALSTEAIAGVVGLSDLLVGLFTICSLSVLFWMIEGPRWWRLTGGAFLVFLFALLGNLSKETMLASLPLLCLFPLGLRILMPRKLAVCFLISCLSTIAATFGLIAYVALRNRYFSLPDADVSPFVSDGPLRQVLVSFFRWFAPPTLPSDPFNNPLLTASLKERLAAGCELFGAQLFQAILPWHLWGDSSYPRGLSAGWSWGACVGAGLLAAGVIGGVVGAFFRRVEPGLWLVAWGGLSLCLSYVPVSNILFALPTVRADRLFYTPTLCLAFLLGGFVHLLGPRLWRWSPRTTTRVGLIFFAVQVTQARAHAMHYTNDVSYWYATSKGAPASAKAHLNLGVMLGARGDLDARLLQTQRAVELSPRWPMGQIYLGDVYCRRGEIERAFEHYERGLLGSANSKSLTALSLQCIWESGSFATYRTRLQELAEARPDSWLDYLVFQLVHSGEANDGIPQKYRPRHYNRRRSGQELP